MVGFGFGYRFSRRQSFKSGNSGGTSGILYGPNYGPKGPKKFLVSAWNQTPTGYCWETDNKTENLYAKWKSRGVNTLKHQNPGFTGVNPDTVLNAAKAEGLMLLASPRWHVSVLGAHPFDSMDYRDLAINDPYWRVNWIGYAFTDEPDLYSVPQSNHVTFFEGHALSGISKPGVVNFTWRFTSPQSPEGTESINWYSFFGHPLAREITHDTYSWHLSRTDASGDDGAPDPSAGGYHLSTFNGYGIYNSSIDASLSTGNKAMKGRRFMSSRLGLNVHVSRSGPMTRGLSLDGGTTILQPNLFDPPRRGVLVVPEALPYAAGDKAVGHYCGPGRVDFGSSSTFPRGGLHAPARYLRDDIWTGVVHGSSHVLLFPQGVGSIVVTGYVNASTQQLVVTTANSRPAPALPNINGSMQVTREDNGAAVGWIRRDGFQLSGTPNGAGTYALDNAKTPTVTTGSAGALVQFRLWPAEGFSADGTDTPNAAELTTATANIRRMEAHPTGGNLLMDTAEGGRRSFTALRCPDTPGRASLYKNDMTQAPVQAGYLPDGTPLLDSAGEGPLWQFGWPMGFEGFTVLGDDGATYIYVKSMSNGNAPTWFPGYASLGLPGRVFGPFELVGFRRVGTGVAVEMTGSSGVLKAGVDEGAATWFYIETAGYAQAEGTDAGTTTFSIVVRRGGVTTGSSTVVATVSGTGSSPANAADFGGTFPTATLSFAAGETSKTFSFNVTRDSTGELDETFAVTLSAPSGGSTLVASGKQTVTCTITNDDSSVIGAFIWLGQSLTGAPALPGSPPGATYLNVNETNNVTRAGITMRSRVDGITSANDYWFGNTPGWLVSNSGQGPLFVLPAGNWEVGFIAASAPWGGGINGSVVMVDAPLGAATVRHTCPVSGAGTVLVDTDNTAYTNTGTAVADAINNLTFLPVIISDLGGGNGLLQLHANGVAICAVALRQA